ncbi:hypothetical protein ACGFX8_01875 [Streptomyces sp. NPDC048362]|uniref:hypothetical protein n=1 Tax=Streptomyces sp. NPDC048362 TaxID=3365539 RepID=UPI00371B457E
MVEADALAPPDAEGRDDEDGDDGDGDEGLAETGVEAGVDGAGRDAVDVPGAVGDARPGAVTSGTLCLTSSAARSRDVWWDVNNPPARPTAATTAATAVPAPAPDHRTARRAGRRRG